MSDMGWRDKDDLDLTNDDIDAMISEGEAVDIRGPFLAGGGKLITRAKTYTGVSTLKRHEHLTQPVGGRVVPTALSR